MLKVGIPGTWNKGRSRRAAGVEGKQGDNLDLAERVADVKSESFASPGVFPWRVVGGVACQESGGMRLLLGSDASLARGDSGPAPGLRRTRAFVSWPRVTREPAQGRAPAAACGAESARLGPQLEPRPFAGRRVLTEWSAAALASESKEPPEWKVTG